MQVVQLHAFTFSLTLYGEGQKNWKTGASRLKRVFFIFFFPMLLVIYRFDFPLWLSSEDRLYTCFTVVNNKIHNKYVDC